jgi:hypothetical protein
MINATQLIVCFAILSSKIRLLSTTGRAQRTVHSLNTSLLTFNSLVNFVTPTEPFTNVVLATENVWQIDATVSWSVKPVSAQQIATLISTVIFNSQKPVRELYSLVNCAIPRICVIWEADAGSTPVRQLVENA